MSAPASLFYDPTVVSVAMTQGMNMLQESERTVWRFIPITELRKRFRVTNEYVRQKLAMLFFPFRSNFVRKGMEGNGGGSANGSMDDDDPFGGGMGFNGGRAGSGGHHGTAGMPSLAATTLDPQDDLAAPDLYLPLMGMITYICLATFIRGVETGTVPPEYIATLTSRSLIFVLLETALLQFIFYVSSFSGPAGAGGGSGAAALSAASMHYLDTVAVFGYIFVGISWYLLTSIVCTFLLGTGSSLPLTTITLVRIIGAYYVASYGYFVFGTLMEAIRWSSGGGSSKVHGGGPGGKKAQMIGGVVALLQLPVFMWLSDKVW